MASFDPLINQTIAGFRLESLLGEGGMGRVYRATQLRLKRPVAVKILPTSLVSKNKLFVKRFLREALAAAQVTHPNVVQVYDAGEYEGTFYIAMELIDGKGLDDLIKEHAVFPLHHAIAIIIQAAQGLAAAQKKNLVHRDIKPGNLMITTEGVVKVADFGLAKNTEATHALTEAGQVLGTPAFMSPEQGRGLPADHRSDLYSLGVTLFAMVTGTLPFQGETPVSIVLKHISEPAPDPRSRNPDIPDSLAEILLCVMAKDPEERFSTGEDFVQALRGVLAEIGADGHVPSLEALAGLAPPPKVRRKPEILPTPDTVDMASEEWSAMHVPSTGPTLLVHKGRGRRRKSLWIAAVVVVLLGAAATLAILSGLPPGNGTTPEPDPDPDPRTDRPPAVPVSLKISGPLDGAISATAKVEVRGRVEAGACKKVLVDDQEARWAGDVFSATLDLEEGTRTIRVVGRPETGPDAVVDLTVIVDLTPPVLDLDAPPRGDRPVNTPKVRIGGTVRDENLESVTVRGRLVNLEGGRFSEDVALIEGRNAVLVEATDRAGHGTRREIVFVLDTRAPVLSLDPVPSFLESSAPGLDLRGEADEDLAQLRVNGEPVPLEGRRVKTRIPLAPGENRIVVAVTDLAGNSGSRTLALFYRRLPAGLVPGPISETYIWTRDASMMVRAAAGPFVMGTDTPPDGHAQEKPAHRVPLSEYYVDVFEVTNRQYRAFLAAVEAGEASHVWHPGDPDRDPTPRFLDQPDFAADDQPVVGVDWFDAWAYARWAGKSLPTEAQWERAASWDAGKSEKREYPWGSVVPDPSYCNFGKRLGKTVAVNQSSTKGLSPVRCRDMAGNAAEWCLDWFIEDFYGTTEAQRRDPLPEKPGFSKQRVLRGGSWADPPDRVRCTARRGYFPSSSLAGPFKAIGFRCVLNTEGD